MRILFISQHSSSSIVNLILSPSQGAVYSRILLSLHWTLILWNLGINIRHSFFFIIDFRPVTMMNKKRKGVDYGISL